MASPVLQRARGYVNRSRTRVLLSHFCSLLAGALYVGWMILLVFCMDLLDHKGQALFANEDARYAHRVAPLGKAEAATLGVYREQNTGLLPTLVRLRAKWYAPALERIHARVPLVRTNIGLLVFIFLIALAIGLVRLGLLLIQSRLLVAATSHAQARLQQEVYDKQFALSGSAIDANNHEKIAPLVARDIPAMLQGVHVYMERIVREPAKILSLVAFALMINLPLTLTFVILSVLAGIVGRQFLGRFVERGRRLEGEANLSVDKLLGMAGNHRLITGYSAEAHYSQCFNRFVQQSKRVAAERLRFQGRLVPLWQFLGLVIFVVVLALAAHNVLTGKFELAAAAGLFASLLSVALPVNNLVEMRRTVHAGAQAASRLFTLLDQPLPAKPKQGTASLPPVQNTIEFEHVTYEDIEGRAILSSVSFRIHRGQRIGIIAKTDAERRAVVYMLARFLEPTTGRVRFDGIDIRRGSIASLRHQVAVVMQSDVLLPDTVAGNIGCGDPGYSLTQITEAAKIAHAHHFIQRLPNGYECVIGDGGFPLKKAEAYRIALARAILRDPPIVCIEELQERLDPDTKSLLDDTMERFCQGRTVVVLPSRLSTLRSCDQIFLIADGKLAAMGTHRELLATSELYRHLQYVDFHTPSFTS